MREALADERPRLAVLVDELEDLRGRMTALLTGVDTTVDDLEIWCERIRRRGASYEGGALMPLDDTPGLCFAVRALKDGRVGAASVMSVDPDAWRVAVSRAIEAAGAEDAPARTFSFGAPSGRQPTPVTCDPQLVDFLDRPRDLRRVAKAVIENTCHELERSQVDFGGLEGELVFTERLRAVATDRNSVGSLHADLQARIWFDRGYGDRCHLVYAPESYLPLALVGARAWLNLPREVATRADIVADDRLPVLVHPRVLESILRATVEPMIAGPRGEGSFNDGERVASAEITLIEDSTLDGLMASRPFDDEGRPTRRNSVIVSGRAAQRLVTRGQAGDAATGSAVRRPVAGQGPETASVVPAFGGLMMLRGDAELHDLVSTVDRAVLVYEIGPVETIAGPEGTIGRFRFDVRAGVTLERGRNSRLLAPGDWGFEGALVTPTSALGQGRVGGLFHELVLSRELYDTGSGILPYCLTMLDVRAPAP